MIPQEDIRASIANALAVDAALTAVVPATRFLHEGADDHVTSDWNDWIEPRLLSDDAMPSRTGSEARVAFEVRVVVRPGTDIYRVNQIADLVTEALRNRQIIVRFYSGQSISVLGHVRFTDSHFVSLGRVDGLNRGTVTLDGRYYPG